MKIRSLVSEFKKGGAVKMQARFPELFSYYFNYWSDPKLPFSEKNINALEKMDARIISSIPKIERALSKIGLATKNISLVTFVGNGTTNGHAAFLKGKWWAWIPVEAYHTQKQIDIFVTHEIAHAIQYAAHPELYFNSIKEKNQTARQIITEGFATLVSQRALHLTDKEALWADFISTAGYKSWTSSLNKERKKIYGFIASNWNKSAAEIFMANDAKKIMKFRVGYGVALLASKVTFTKSDSLVGFLEMPTKKTKQALRAFIKNGGRNT